MKILLTILTVCLLLSCKSVVDQNIAKWISENAHNPDSYEPISTSINDTTFSNDSIKSYWFIHKCRIAVPLGGKMLKEFNVSTDEKYNILYVTERK
jgi:hypothetical protein